MRLTGPGSELPPVPDAAQRSPDDPQFYSASLWLMERGSMQVRIAVHGAHGDGTLAVPVAASALRTLEMDRGLGALLFALMLLLATSLVAIVGAAVGQAALPPDAAPRSPMRTRVAAAIATAVVTGLLVAGNAWWTDAATDYASTIAHPWQLQPTRDGCTLRLPRAGELLPDHGHDMHLFLLRTPAMDVLAHLHPTRGDDGAFTQALPSLPAGHYQMFADIVLPSGYPVTGVTQLELPDLSCGDVAGDDTVASAPSSRLPYGGRMIWDRPDTLHAGRALTLRFHVVDGNGAPAQDLEPYMGMVAHAEIVRADMSVFAHVHPDGSVPMAALELARGGGDMAGMPGMVAPAASGAPATTISPDLSFPFGFPQPGSYRVFVQIKRSGHIETGAFDALVE